MTSMTTASFQPVSLRRRELPREFDLSRALAGLDQRLTQYPEDHEAALLKGLLYLEAGSWNDARRELQDLTTRVPRFRLAHLVYADLMLAMGGKSSVLGQGVEMLSLGDSEELLALRDEARLRVDAYLQTDHMQRFPAALLALDDGVKNAVVVDKSAHRLYLYRNNGSKQPPELVKDFYVSTGRAPGNKVKEGDLKTPEGVYFITSFLPDDALPEKYGIGAFPVNYPNEWDRHLGKTGDGIWLHGTDPIYYSRPPLDSEGCVVLANLDLSHIESMLQPGLTPVVISEQVHWLNTEQWQMQRNQLLGTLERWRSAWQDKAVDEYLGFYARDFWNGRYNLAGWRAMKRQVAQGKTYQQIRLEDISLFAYPKGEGQPHDMVVAVFTQDYRSNNFSSSMKKRLYLTREQNDWKVLYEGAAH